MSKTKTELQNKTEPNQYAEGEYDHTPHGTKYRVLRENHIIVYPDSFVMDKDRLVLFEEFLDAKGGFFARFIKDAIWEKMDNEIRNADVEELGKRVKARFFKRWNFSRQYDNNPAMLLQDPINQWG